MTRARRPKNAPASPASPTAPATQNGPSKPAPARRWGYEHPFEARNRLGAQRAAAARDELERENEPFRRLTRARRAPGALFDARPDDDELELEQIEQFEEP